MDVADPEIKPAAGLFLSAAVVGVVVVLLEDFPDLALPLGLFDIRATPSVVSGKVVVIPDAVDRYGLCQFHPLGLALAAVVVEQLHFWCFRVVDINIVAEQ